MYAIMFCVLLVLSGCGGGGGGGTTRPGPEPAPPAPRPEPVPANAITACATTASRRRHRHHRRHRHRHRRQSATDHQSTTAVINPPPPPPQPHQSATATTGHQSATAAAAAATAATSIRHRQPPVINPPPPVINPPPPCSIPIPGGGCLSVQHFQAEALRLALKYRTNDLSFAKQWGLNAVNADRAYANVELLKGQTAKPGAGVTIGFLDTGIDKDHPMFDGKTVSEVFLDGATNETGDKFSHGTAVASLAAGLRSGSLTSSANGVAWGADIAMFAIRAGSASGNYSPISLAGLSSADAGWAGLITTVLDWRDGQRAVDFLNLSVGYQGIIDSYSEQDLRANFGTAIAAMAQARPGDKTILIWSAGNAHGDPCDPAVVDAVREWTCQCGFRGGDARSGGAHRGTPGPFPRRGGVATE